MRLVVTSDLHVDHGRSQHLAHEIAAEINRLDFDVLLVVGDTATSRATGLEEGLAMFTHPGEKLVTLGNHELWAGQGDTLDLYHNLLPSRIRETGWKLLDESPTEIQGIGFVGNVGWYDYSYAPEHLNIPRRFYEAKVSPGSAAYYTAYRHLLADPSDIPESAHEVYARWNDGRHIRWNTTDEGFTQLLLDRLRDHLTTVAHLPRVIAAVHHLPLKALLPPRSTPAWDFAKAYLGSERFGQLISEFPNVTHVFSGHSHFPAKVQLANTLYHATGSGYRLKHYHIYDL